MVMKKSYLSLVVLSALSASAMADTTIDKMFSEGSVQAELRLNDYSRDYEINKPGRTAKDLHDTAIGGLLYYKTAKVNGISFGTSFASSNPLWAEDSKATYNLLSEGHTETNRMQEYYVQGDWLDTTFKLGAQELKGPVMNGHDIRFLPKTYRGFTIENRSIENLTLSAQYITDSADWDDHSFTSLAEAMKNELKSYFQAANRGSLVEWNNLQLEDNPVYTVGASYKLPTQTVKGDFQVWNYYMEDTFNQVYARAKLSTDLGKTNFYFIPTYWSQNFLSQLDNAQYSNVIQDTEQWGFQLGTKLDCGVELTYLYAQTGDGNLITPWGGMNVVLQQVNISQFAEEDINGFRVAYDLGKVGVNGLTATVFYGDYNEQQGSLALAQDDYDEVNFGLTYKFDGALSGLSMRARYALVDSTNGAEDHDDLRFNVSYKFGVNAK